MTSPSGPTEDPSSAVPGLPPHLDPRGGRRPGRGRRSRTARVLTWVALSLAVLMVGVAGAGAWAFNHYDGQISRINAFGQGRVMPPAAPADAQNFLLVGSDSRVGANGQGTQGTGASFVSGQRSDTVILAHLYGTSDQVQLVSFPRDSYVQIPTYTDPVSGKVVAARMDKLNSAFAEGGAPLLIATIENLTDIRVDHFLQVDFTGFKSMVDTLGGVDVCLTTAAKDRYTGIDLSAGDHHIDGDVALAFVRQRYSLPNGDLDRIARQQQFIGALANKLLAAGTLLNPFKLNGFLDAATSSLQADQGLSGGDLKDLVVRMRGFSSGGVSFATIPIADLAGKRKGQDVVLLDQAKGAVMFDALRRDQAPPVAEVSAAAPVDLTVAPADIRVSVYNGTDTAGLGSRAAGDLRTVGFTVVGTPTSRGSGATGTTVRYGPTRADSARTLAAALPAAVLEADPALGGTLEVVLGSDYAGTVPVSVTGSTSAVAPPLKTALNNTCTA